MVMVKFECEDCGNRFDLERVDVFADGTTRPPGHYVYRDGECYNGDGYRMPPTREGYRVDGRIMFEPVCPCGWEELRQEMAAPAIGSTATRNTDAIAADIMQRQGLTDMKDNLRAGDPSAPKIAPHLQQMSDNMFSKKNPARQSISVASMGSIGGRAGSKAMGMLQSGVKSGKVPDVLRPIDAVTGRRK